MKSPTRLTNLTHSPPPVALVTGAARRVGATIARVLHGAGFNLIVHYRDSAEQANTLTDELNQLRAHSAQSVQCDLADLSAIAAFATRVQQAFGHLDVLVHNAAQFFASPLTEATPAQWDQLMQINLKAPFFLSQHCAPILTEQQGTIICIADMHGVKPLKHHAIYSISQAALIMMSQSLARELAPAIRVNAVAPGPVAWPEGDNALSGAQQADLTARSLLERCGTPEDVAQAVLFLAQSASATTGQVIHVEAGRLLVN